MTEVFNIGQGVHISQKMAVLARILMNELPVALDIRSAGFTGGQHCLHRLMTQGNRVTALAVYSWVRDAGARRSTVICLDTLLIVLCSHKRLVNQHD